MDPIHPYERLPLFGTGIALGLWLVISHAWLLAKPAQAQAMLQTFPRHRLAGQILLAIGMAWFWLLVAPSGMGLLSHLSMDLGEFNDKKALMRLAVPITYVLVIYSVHDFLAVRALGVVGLMAATPLLEAAFLKDPASRLLIPTFAYALIIASLYFVGMPYLFRDAVTWVTAKKERWNAAAAGGLVYGLAVLVCAITSWRGH